MMLTKREVAVAVIATALSTLLTSTALADSATATLSVSVRVKANAVAQLESAPAGITVTEADISRGYVDLTGPIRVRVRSNSPRYLLTVTRLNEAFGPLSLNWEGGSMRVMASEAWAARPSVPGGDSLVLQGRLSLPPSILPGTYDLPFGITATPL